MIGIYFSSSVSFTICRLCRDRFSMVNFLNGVLTGTDVAHVRTVEHGVRVGVTRVVRERSLTAGRVVTVSIVARNCKRLCAYMLVSA